MTAERMGTTRTAWAAGWDDLPCATGQTRQEAEDAALDALTELLDDGTLEPEDVQGSTLTIYRDVLWCVGSDDQCACMGMHDEDEEQVMISCVGWEKATISVNRAATNYDGYNLEVSDG